MSDRRLMTWDNAVNNQSHQSEQLVMTSNPTSAYNSLERDKMELARKTTFSSYSERPAAPTKPRP